MKSESTFNSVDSLIQKGISLAKAGVLSHDKKWCYTSPVVLELTHPLARFVTFKKSKINFVQIVAKSLWVLSGMNSTAELLEPFDKEVVKQTNDGRTIRNGVGPRLRYYTGEKSLYAIDHQVRSVYNTRATGFTDQFATCIKRLQEDKNTTDAVIVFQDPVKDMTNRLGEIATASMPEAISLHFLNVEGRLDCYAHFLKDDIHRPDNVAIFSFIHQIVAQLSGLKLGSYFHCVDCLYCPSDIKEPSDTSLSPVEMDAFEYKEAQLTVNDIDQSVSIMLDYLGVIGKGNNLTAKNPFYTDNRVAVFSDYAEIFRLYFCKQFGVEVENGEFYHPQLQVCFEKGIGGLR